MLSEDVMLCIKLYFMGVAVFGLFFYIIHRFIPYDPRWVPKDFCPPYEWIGSFAKGQLVGFLIKVFLGPLALVMAALFAILGTDDDFDIAALICSVFLVFIMLLSVKIERKIDEW